MNGMERGEFPAATRTGPENAWQPLRPRLAPDLVDARLQLHHAVQLASAFGISFSPPELDDGHTSLEWSVRDAALASRSVLDMRVALNVARLALHVDGRAHALRGRTLAEAEGWVRSVLAAEGFAGDRYTLRRHFEIPPHPVADGAAFGAQLDHLEELGRWFSNGAFMLDRLRDSGLPMGRTRCWPHHFDIAALVGAGPGRTVGVGLEPGDGFYPEPYFYVSPHRRPDLEGLLARPLRGGGWWHTEGWLGAVLSGSSLTPDPRGQELQVAHFVESAVEAALE